MLVESTLSVGLIVICIPLMLMPHFLRAYAYYSASHRLPSQLLRLPCDTLMCW